MKKAKEIEVVTLMIKLYCKKQHKQVRKEQNIGKNDLCPECQELLEYVEFRRSKCPWGDKKPFCANCPIQCYKPDMKERIRKVMRYSGPRMIFSHPIIAISHVVETLTQRKKLKVEREEKERKQQEAREKADRIKALIAEGKTPEEALREVEGNAQVKDSNNDAK